MLRCERDSFCVYIGRGWRSTSAAGGWRWKHWSMKGATFRHSRWVPQPWLSHPCSRPSARLKPIRYRRRGTYNSLNYVLNTSLRKIFRTKSTDVVKDRMLVFNCQKAEDAIFYRKSKFTNYASLDNLICSVFQNCANAAIAVISVKSYVDQRYRLIAYHCYERVCVVFFHIACSFVIRRLVLRRNYLECTPTFLLRVWHYFWCIFLYFSLPLFGEWKLYIKSGT